MLFLPFLPYLPLKINNNFFVANSFSHRTCSNLPAHRLGFAYLMALYFTPKISMFAYSYRSFFPILNEFVNRSRISQLEYMSDKASYPLTLDFFHFIYSQKRCSARFNLHVCSNVLKNIGDSNTFP